MSASRYDVVVVGAGCAGLTAAIGLARNGFSVAVIEAAAKVGGAGALGGVFFAENLVHPDLLGPGGVEGLAWERRLIERGRFATDGRRIAGTFYRDAAAFRHCYIVLRPLFDHHLALLARQHGVAILTETTVESLIREGRRIIGLATTRGPLYSELVFLAEGDAGHLVSREGFDRFSDPRAGPTFLYCLQQVMDLPPGVIEECFRVGPEQGVAYDFLLRNPAHSSLNARGQLYSNCQGLTLSVVVPAEKLHQGFAGEPRQLLDWFVDMPVLRPWLRDGQRGAWTTTLIRCGGLRDVPYLVEDGLVVGGAAAGLGIDFPVLNLTGPATVTGLFLSRAAARIRAEGRDFDRDALSRHYVEPLQQTRYWKDRAFLNRWPGHLRRTNVLFDRGLDLFLDSAAVWGRSRRWLPWKLLSWLRVLGRMPWLGWDELRNELIHLSRALHLRDVAPRPALARVLLDGALNAFRDLVRRPRPHLPPYGTLRLYFHSSEEEGRASAVPRLLRRWFERFRAVLASAGHQLYANEDTPLAAKWTRTLELFLRQVNLFDLVAAAVLALGIAALSMPLTIGRALIQRLRRRRGELWLRARSVSEGNATLAYAAGSETICPPAVTPHASRSTAPPHDASVPLIHVMWRSTQPLQQAASVQDLPHICPARVFEVKGAAPEIVQVIVHAERCIHCEACWRTIALVSWGRNGTPPMLPPLFSPVETRLHQAEAHAALAEPAASHCFDPWDGGDHERGLPLRDTVRKELASLLDHLEHKLQRFDRVLVEGPAAVDRSHNDYLEMLARYAQQLIIRIVQILEENAGLTQRARDVASAIAALAEKRTRRTWEGRFAWAAADGRLLRQHHLTGLRRLLRLETIPRKVPDKEVMVPKSWLTPALMSVGLAAWGKHLLAGIAARRYLLESLAENPKSATNPHQDELLDALFAEARDDLTARTEEWNALGIGELKPVPPVSSPAVTEVYRRHGSRLLLDVEQIGDFLNVPADWEKLSQRRVLLAERAEILEAERRLFALASDRRAAGRDLANTDALRTSFGRQAAHVLAGKQLLLRIFSRFEEGAEDELAIVLLRVWLDHAAILLDQLTIAVRDRQRPFDAHRERPLVELGSGPPLRTEAEYLAAAEPYTSGDFLLAPIDFLCPRLVPEMTDAGSGALAERAAADLARILHQFKVDPEASSSSPEMLYLAEALIVEMIGRCTHSPLRPLDLEMACMYVVLSDLRQDGGALPQRCLILQVLAEEVVPRWQRGGLEPRARHLERDLLELEALKGEFRQRLTAVWQVFETSLGRNANVQASCFALAEAAAWLKAADSALGRMAWISRLSQAEDRDEPAAQQNLGRRVLRHCDAVIRDRLFRFDEDLASLRRGYYAPHVRAADLLLHPSTKGSSKAPLD